jgi:RNA polymerase sigma factor (sigma-70 family)
MFNTEAPMADSLFVELYAALHAAQTGNTPTQPQEATPHHTDTSEFQNWFGESKVRHPETGKPLAVYHGSGKTEKFDAFRPQQSRRGIGFMGAERTVESPVHFFSESPSMAHFFRQNRASSPSMGRVYKVHLSIKNPLDLTGDTRSNRRLLKSAGIEHDPGKQNMWELFDDPEVVSKLRAAGYDGALISERAAAKSFGMTPGNKNLRPTPTAEDARLAARTWVAFHPTQIKSVANQGTWNPQDERMDYDQEGSEPATELQDTLPDIPAAAPTPRQPDLTPTAMPGLKVREPDQARGWKLAEGHTFDESVVAKMQARAKAKGYILDVRPMRFADGRTRHHLTVYHPKGQRMVNPQEFYSADEGEPASPAPLPQFKPGQRMPAGYVYHNTNREAVESIGREGMDAGSFSHRPIDFGGDTHLAVHRQDLPEFQEHQYGKVTAFEPRWQIGQDEQGYPVTAKVAPHKIHVVDARGRFLRTLASPPQEPDQYAARHIPSSPGQQSLFDGPHKGHDVSNEPRDARGEWTKGGAVSSPQAETSSPTPDHAAELTERLNRAVDRQSSGAKLGRGGMTAQQAIAQAMGDSKRKTMSHEQACRATFLYTGTKAEDWNAVAVKGTTTVDVPGGTQREMPEFDFPAGYTHPPVLFESGADNATCELCSHPIKNVYWIQNDKEKLTIAVGSECVTMFGSGQSGKQLTKRAVADQNRDLLKQAWDARDQLARKFGYPRDPETDEHSIDNAGVPYFRLLDHLGLVPTNSRDPEVQRKRQRIRDKGEAIHKVYHELNSLLHTKQGGKVLHEKRDFLVVRQTPKPYGYGSGYNTHKHKESVEQATDATVTRWVKANAERVRQLMDDVDLIMGDDQTSLLREPAADPAAKYTAAFHDAFVDRYARLKSQAGQLGLFDEQHPRGQPENAGEFRPKSAVPVAQVSDAPEPDESEFAPGKRAWEMLPDEIQNATPLGTRTPGYDLEGRLTPAGQIRQLVTAWGKRKWEEAGKPQGKAGTHIVAMYDRLGSDAGEHRIVVEQAIHEGREVPPEVLAKYSDLAKPASDPDTTGQNPAAPPLQNVGISQQVPTNPDIGTPQDTPREFWQMPVKEFARLMHERERPFTKSQKTWDQWIKDGVPEADLINLSGSGHEVYVKDAIEKGKPVPPEVLADYPDLQKQGEIRKPAPTPGTTAPSASGRPTGETLTGPGGGDTKSDPFGTGAGQKFRPTNMPDMVSRDFAYSIQNDVPVPAGGKVVASSIVQRSVRGHHPLFRFSVVENPDGTRYVLTENGRDTHGSLAGAETAFHRLDDRALQSKALAGINRLSDQLWEKHKPGRPDAPGLFSAALSSALLREYYAQRFADRVVERYAAKQESPITEHEDEYGRYRKIDGAIDPSGNWKRFDAIPPEQHVVMYHATNRQAAQDILANGWNPETAAKASAFTNTPPDYVYMGGKGGLGSYIGHGGKGDPVLLAFRVQRQHLEPDAGTDWKSHVRQFRKDITRHHGREAITNPTATHTYANINQVRAHHSRVEPIGILDPEGQTSTHPDGWKFKSKGEVLGGPEQYAQQARLFDDAGGAPRKEFDETKHQRAGGQFARKYPRVLSREVQPALPGVDLPPEQRVVTKRRPVGQAASTPVVPAPAYPEGHEFHVSPLVSNGGASYQVPVRVHKLDATHAHIGYGDAPEVGYKSDGHIWAKIPRESLEHFVNDLQGKVNVPPDHHDHRINMIANGQAKFLGKGDDGMAFDTGDHVVKVSTVVPFHWTNYHGTYTPEHAAKTFREKVSLNNEMLDAGVPGLLKQGFFHHGGKGFATMPKLQIPERFEQHHIDQMRETLDAMHAKDYVLRDDVQAGIGQDGRAYMFDTGKAKKLEPGYRWADEDKRSDRDNLKRLADKHGLENPWAKDDAKEAYNSWDNRMIRASRQAKEGKLTPHMARQLLEIGQRNWDAMLAQDPEQKDWWDLSHQQNVELLQSVIAQGPAAGAAQANKEALYSALWDATLDRYDGTGDQATVVHPHGTPEYAANQRDWHAESHAITKDHDGAPKRLFHGTNAPEFNAFDPDRLGKSTKARTALLGHFVTDRTETSNMFAHGEGGHVHPVHVFMKKPFIVDDFDDNYLTNLQGAPTGGMEFRNFRKRMATPELEPFSQLHGFIANVTKKPSWKDVTPEDVVTFREHLKSRGYDGIVVRKTVMDAGTNVPTELQGRAHPTSDHYIVFDPTQIKSATANRGTWDRTNARMDYDQDGSAPTQDIGADLYTALWCAQQGLERYKATPEGPFTSEWHEWFGDSKIRNRHGHPLTVYHGTREDFDALDTSDRGLDDSLANQLGDNLGGFFTTRPSTANDFAQRGKKAGHRLSIHEINTNQWPEGAAVVPAHLSIKNPKLFRTQEEWRAFLKQSPNARQAMEQAGHDGVVIRRAGYSKPDSKETWIVAFHPHQVKSIHNPRPTEDPRMMYALRPDPRQTSLFDQSTTGLHDAKTRGTVQPGDARLTPNRPASAIANTGQLPDSLSAALPPPASAILPPRHQARHTALLAKGFRRTPAEQQEFQDLGRRIEELRDAQRLAPQSYAQQLRDAILDRYRDLTSTPEQAPPTTGEPIHHTKTPEFKRFFGDWEAEPHKASKVVDMQGKPLRLIHGTSAEPFDAFDAEKIGSNTGNHGWYGKGFSFTTNPEIASGYSGHDDADKPKTGARSIPVYLSIRNPFRLSSAPERISGERRSFLQDVQQLKGLSPDEHATIQMLKSRGDTMFADSALQQIFGHSKKGLTQSASASERFRELLEANGHDGVHTHRHGMDDEYTAFHPHQIKSATANRGTWDPEDERMDYEQDQNPVAREPYAQFQELVALAATLDRYKAKDSPGQRHLFNEEDHPRAPEGAKGGTGGQFVERAPDRTTDPSHDRPVADPPPADAPAPESTTEPTPRRPDAPPGDNEELVARLQAGDKTAFDQLLAQNRPFIADRARKAGAREGHDLEDWIQEGSVILWQAASKFDPQQGNKFTTYLGTALDRRFWKLRKKEIGTKDKPRPRHLQGAVDDEGRAVHEPVASPDETPLAEQELKKAVRKVVRDMPNPRHQQIVQLAFGLDGPPLTHAQIAEQLGVRPQAVQQQLARILPTLQRQLQDQYAARCLRDAILERYHALAGARPERYAQTLDTAQPDHTETPEFREWFGESHVRHTETGKPLTVYHGTSDVFDSFRNDLPVHFFDESPEYPGNIGKAVMPVHLSIQNPYMGAMDGHHVSKYADEIKAELMAKGYDGLKTKDGYWVAFHPHQIKSATGNRGTYSSADPRINYTQAFQDAYRDRYGLADLAGAALSRVTDWAKGTKSNKPQDRTPHAQPNRATEHTQTEQRQGPPPGTSEPVTAEAVRPAPKPPEPSRAALAKQRGAAIQRSAAQQPAPARRVGAPGIFHAVSVPRFHTPNLQAAHDALSRLHSEDHIQDQAKRIVDQRVRAHTVNIRNDQHEYRRMFSEQINPAREAVHAQLRQQAERALAGATKEAEQKAEVLRQAHAAARQHRETALRFPEGHPAREKMLAEVKEASANIKRHAASLKTLHQEVQRLHATAPEKPGPWQGWSSGEGKKPVSDEERRAREDERHEVGRARRNLDWLQRRVELPQGPTGNPTRDLETPEYRQQVLGLLDQELAKHRAGGSKPKAKPAGAATPTPEPPRDPLGNANQAVRDFQDPSQHELLAGTIALRIVNDQIKAAGGAPLRSPAQLRKFPGYATHYKRAQQQAHDYLDQQAQRAIGAAEQAGVDPQEIQGLRDAHQGKAKLRPRETGFEGAQPTAAELTDEQGNKLTPEQVRARKAAQTRATNAQAKAERVEKINTPQVPHPQDLPRHQEELPDDMRAFGWKPPANVTAAQHLMIQSLYGLHGTPQRSFHDLVNETVRRQTGVGPDGPVAEADQQRAAHQLAEQVRDAIGKTRTASAAAAYGMDPREYHQIADQAMHDEVNRAAKHNALFDRLSSAKKQAQLDAGDDHETVLRGFDTLAYPTLQEAEVPGLTEQNAMQKAQEILEHGRVPVPGPHTDEWHQAVVDQLGAPPERSGDDEEPTPDEDEEPVPFAARRAPDLRAELYSALWWATTRA